MTRTSDDKKRLAHRAANRRGRYAEFAGLILLCFKGYRPLARRWRGRKGEIDLIVTRRSVLVFVEIKYRRSLASAGEALTSKQQARIVAAAGEWLSARGRAEAFASFRFDALLFAPWAMPRHVVGAFDAT